MRRTLVATPALLWSSHSIQPRLIPAPSTSRSTSRSPCKASPPASLLAHPFSHSARLHASDSDEGTAERAPRKRGRPRKSPVSAEAAGGGGVEADGGTKTTATVTEPQEPKRRRGRPPKAAKTAEEAAADDFPKAEAEAERNESLSPRRGRPPKTASTQDAQGDEDRDGPGGSSDSFPATARRLDEVERPVIRPSRPDEPEKEVLIDPHSPGFRKLLQREEQWEANPWLHMLASPLRRCSVSKTTLPTDLMICFKQAYIQRPDSPSSKRETYVLPDRILHPKFSLKKLGKGMWTVGAKAIVEEFIETREYKRHAPTAQPPKRLIEMVEHQLRERVLQEAELLEDRVIGTRPDALRGAGALPAVAFLDLSLDAPAVSQALGGQEHGSETASPYGQPPTFGLCRLMGFAPAPPPSAAPAEGDTGEDDTGTDKNRDKEDTLTKSDPAQAEKQMQKLLRHLRRSVPIIDRALPTQGSLKNYQDAGKPIPVRKHKFAVPLFIALLRLARFVE